MIASHCDCLICRLETTLIADLSDEKSNEEFKLLSVSCPILSIFPTASDLIRHLHDHGAHAKNLSTDQLILTLLSPSDMAFRSMWQRLLLLAFIPTMHRTTSHIAAIFPSLARDDIAQHIFSVLLEFLDSKELQSRQTHLAFTIARKMRRSAFRWAIRESRNSLQEPAAIPETPIDTEMDCEESHINLVLQQFLDNCQRRGVLSSEERRLLTQFKLEGVPASELARRNGHSAIALRHRIQRLVARLRRAARNPGHNAPEQLNLFAP